MKYIEFGKDNKETIILLHGGGLSWWNYKDVAELLKDEYHIILPILDGHAGSDRDFRSIEDNAKEIIKNREYTTTELTKLGFTVLNSKANFVFAKTNKISGEDLYIKLKEKGVLVRHFNGERIKEFNRITIGSLEEMQLLIEKIKEIFGEL